MPFSFFTKPAQYASKRLRFVARALQVFGVAAGALIAKSAFDMAKLVMMEWPAASRHAFLERQGFLAAGVCISFFFAGRALHRRQRSGAWGAAASIGLPLIYYVVMQAGYPYFPWYFDVIQIGVPLISLALVASVWRELGSVRDSEFVNHGPAPEQTISFIPRQRGARKSHILPLDKVPSITAPARSGIHVSTSPDTGPIPNG